VSVVLAARDSASTLPAQLAALADQTYAGPWELVFVDDGSRDDTLAVVRAWEPRLPALRAIARGARSSAHAGDEDVPRGCGRARNYGVGHSRGELLLFCDGDDIVDRRWIERMVDGLRRYPAVGGRIERTLLNDDVALAVRPDRDGLLDGGFGFLPYPMGANCAMRREVWERLGGFDENYSRAEDVELFWRAQLQGFELGFSGDAVVHYRLPVGARALARQGYSYGLGHPRLYRDFARHGMPASRAAAGREWAWLVTHPHHLARGRRARARWLYRLAMRLGRLAGSAENRVVHL
jgi:glycosyltransferase involved in cell wall biosynthesis